MNSLKSIPISILDGGLGTSLEDKYHVQFSTKTPLWSSQLLLSNQTTLSKCQSDFALAGADIILTATYQASIRAFEASGIHGDDNIITHLGDAIKIAKDASSCHSTVHGRGEVALSIGPYGATMIPSTEYSAQYDDEHADSDKLMEWHKKRFDLFVRLDHSLLDSVSRIAFETVPRLDEIVALRRMMEHLPQSSRLTQIPFWISCVYPGDDNRLPDGSSVDQVVDTLLDKQVSKSVPWGIGINCTKVGKLPFLVKEYESAVRRHVDSGNISEWPTLVLYPDGTNGEVYNTETKKWEVPDGIDLPKTPWELQLADVVKKTSETGRWRSIIVGGCCKTTDKDIARLRHTLLSYKN